MLISLSPFLTLLALLTTSTRAQQVQQDSNHHLEARATTVAAAACPSIKYVVGSFWPAYYSAQQSPAKGVAQNSKLAFYFVLPTTAKGFELPSNQPASDVIAFVKAAKAKSQKALFVLGGWTGSVYFSDLVSTNAKRVAFAKQIQTFMTTYSFDGVEIDWEYIGKQGVGNNKVRTTDAASFLTFLATLRSTLGTSKIISAAFPAQGLTGPKGTYLMDVSKYAAYLNYATLMTYDFYGNSWSTTSGPNSPLNVCQEGASSVSTSIAAWIAAGFPACKILMGVPGYSHTFTTKTGTLVKTKYKGVYTQSFQPLASTQTADPSLTFNQLIKAGYLNSAGTAGAGGYKRYWDACTMTPFLFYPYKKQWITYDDASSIGHKALLARKLGLAGVNFFDSTGTTSAIFTAAKKGVSGTWSATSARRRSRRSEIPEGEGEEEEVVEQGEFDFDVQLDDEVVLEEDIDEEWSVPVMSQLEDLGFESSS